MENHAKTHIDPEDDQFLSLNRARTHLVVCHGLDDDEIPLSKLKELVREGTIQHFFRGGKVVLSASDLSAWALSILATSPAHSLEKFVPGSPAVARKLKQRKNCEVAA